MLSGRAWGSDDGCDNTGDAASYQSGLSTFYILDEVNLFDEYAIQR